MHAKHETNHIKPQLFYLSKYVEVFTTFSWSNDVSMIDSPHHYINYNVHMT